MSNIDGLGFDFDKFLTTKCKGCGNLLLNCTCEKIKLKKDDFKLIELDEIKCPNCKRPFMNCVCPKESYISFQNINNFNEDCTCPYNCGRLGCYGECKIKYDIKPKFEKVMKNKCPKCGEEGCNGKCMIKNIKKDNKINIEKIGCKNCGQEGCNGKCLLQKK